MKNLFLKFPEYYLIIIVLLAGYSPPFSFNPIFIGILLISILQVIIKNRIFGFVIGSVFLLANLYLLLALTSEFNEFTAFNNNAKQLLFGGLTLWIMNMVMSITMLYKYSKTDFKNNTQIETISE